MPTVTLPMRVSMPTVTLPMQLSLDLDYVTAKQTFYMDDLINIHNNIKTDHSLVVYFYQWDPSLFHHKKELLHSTLIPPISANKQNIVTWIIFNFKSLWNKTNFLLLKRKLLKVPDYHWSEAILILCLLYISSLSASGTN